MKWFLLLVLGAALLVVLWLMFRKKKPAADGFTDLANLRVTDARRGDNISIHAAGRDFEDVDFTVERRNTYESGGDEWFELMGRHRGQMVSVEVYEDDAVEVTAVLSPETLTLADLRISEDDLIRFDEQRDSSQFVEYRGNRWYYQESCEIVYYRDGRGEGEGYYCWDFSEDRGNRVLSIEKWEGEDFEAMIGVRVNPDDVTVFRA